MVDVEQTGLVGGERFEREPATSWGICLNRRTRRNWDSAASIPAAVHRSAISPCFQRFTRREWSRTISIIDSIGLVDSMVLSSAPVTPSRLTVTVSASPSRRLAAAPGRFLSRLRAIDSSWRAAVSASGVAHASRSRRCTSGRSASGRWSRTLRSLWRRHLAISALSPKVTRIAFASALPPSTTNSTRGWRRGRGRRGR